MKKFIMISGCLLLMACGTNQVSTSASSGQAFQEDISILTVPQGELGVALQKVQNDPQFRFQAKGSKLVYIGVSGTDAGNILENPKVQKAMGEETAIVIEGKDATSVGEFTQKNFGFNLHQTAYVVKFLEGTDGGKAIYPIYTSGGVGQQGAEVNPSNVGVESVLKLSNLDTSLTSVSDTAVEPEWVSDQETSVEQQAIPYKLTITEKFKVKDDAKSAEDWFYKEAFGAQYRREFFQRVPCWNAPPSSPDLECRSHRYSQKLASYGKPKVKSVRWFIDWRVCQITKCIVSLVKRTETIRGSDRNITTEVGGEQEVGGKFNLAPLWEFSAIFRARESKAWSRTWTQRQSFSTTTEDRGETDKGTMIRFGKAEYVLPYTLYLKGKHVTMERHRPTFSTERFEVAGRTFTIGVATFKTDLKYKSDWTAKFNDGTKVRFSVDVWASCKVGDGNCVRRWESGDSRLFGL